MKIEHGYKVEKDVLYWDYLPNIPVFSPFGHLGEKFVFLMYRLHFLNETVDELYEYQKFYFDCRKNSKFDNNIKLKYLHRAFRFSTEIKIILDEFMSLYYVLNYHKQNQSWPDKILVDSIGAYLSPKNKINYNLFDKYNNLLEVTNNIGNAVKHSSYNSDVTWIRNDSIVPLLLAYYHKQNDTKNQVEFHKIELAKYLEELNLFLPEYNYDVKNNYS